MDVKRTEYRQEGRREAGGRKRRGLGRKGPEKDVPSVLVEAFILQ